MVFKALRTFAPAIAAVRAVLDDIVVVRGGHEALNVILIGILPRRRVGGLVRRASTPKVPTPHEGDPQPPSWCLALV